VSPSRRVMPLGGKPSSARTSLPIKVNTWLQLSSHNEFTSLIVGNSRKLLDRTVVYRSRLGLQRHPAQKGVF